MTTPTTPELEYSWVDKYRPHTLEDVALSAENRERLQGFINQGVIPRHLIFYGKPGLGKTSVARILANEIYEKHRPETAAKWGHFGTVMEVDATKSGNAEYIRSKVVLAMQTTGARLIIFDEASGLTREGASHLRKPLEEYTWTKVIFITNHIEKLDEAIKDRCDWIEFVRPPVEECARVLGHVLESEQVSATPQEVLDFTKRHFGQEREGFPCTMRTLLSAAQQSVKSGKLEVPPARSRGDHAQQLWEGAPSTVEDTEEGAKILNELTAQFSKYISLPPGGAETLALWTVFAWAHEAFSVSPILTLMSPTMRAGKTTVAEMLEDLLIPDEVYHPSNATPAFLFRIAGFWDESLKRPALEPRYPRLVLLADEVDTWFTVRKELQGIISGGHVRKSASVPRVLPDGTPVRFSVWYPKLLALRNLPESPLPAPIRDRSIILSMERKPRGVELPKFPRERELPEFIALRERIVAWVRDHFQELKEAAAADLSLPEQLDDRAKDNWKPLIAITQVAGGAWSERAQRAATIISDTTREVELVIELLSDIEQVFATEQVDEIRTSSLVQKLKALEAGPWKERRLNANKLAAMLRPLRIGPHQDVGGPPGSNWRGYIKEDFHKAWDRYLREEQPPHA